MPADDELAKRRLLKSREVCALLSISARTLWTWQEKGQIPYYRIGGSIRFKLADIEELLRRCRAGAQLPG
jgi:excisionase family DNA binding protein